ncbi:MAG: putative hydrolase [Candidatus Saccharibacteria bacterium]|nr:putative hydrolase [Candidatus Saccharibacteria bacterium]
MSSDNKTSCTLLFLVRPGEILLAMKKRGFGKGLWNGVGGKIDTGESIEQAMLRECEEEIAVRPIVYHKVAIHEFLYQASDLPVIVHAYLCTEWAGEPQETEEMAPQWFNQSAIPFDKMWEDDQFWLPQVLDGQKLRAKFIFSAQEKLLEKTIINARELE